MDLAEGHVAALKYIESSASSTTASTTGGNGFGQYSVFNLGTGTGYR